MKILRTFRIGIIKSTLKKILLSDNVFLKILRKIFFILKTMLGKNT